MGGTDAIVIVALPLMLDLALVIALATLLDPAPRACPDGMALVRGTHYEIVQRLCIDHRGPGCFAFFPGLDAVEGIETHVETCMDVYEWPSKKGELPAVNVSYRSAKARCEKAARGGVAGGDLVLLTRSRADRGDPGGCDVADALGGGGPRGGRASDCAVPRRRTGFGSRSRRCASSGCAISSSPRREGTCWIRPPRWRSRAPSDTRSFRALIVVNEAGGLG